MSTEFITLNEGWNAEPNAPHPQIQMRGADLHLTFYVNASPFPQFNEEDVGRLVFTNCVRYRLGSTNDEGWWRGQCRFSKLAPRWGEFYEIKGDPLLQQCPRDWKETGTSTTATRHFLFYFRDETFECVADEWSFGRTEELVPFRFQYSEMIARLLRAPKAGDGYSESELAALEKRRKIKLPAALRDFYRVAGRIDPLNRAHDRLLTPAKIRIGGNHLTFYEENQAVVVWGIPTNMMHLDNPPVFQCPGDPTTDADWYQESDTVSHFLIAMTHVQAGLGGLLHCANAALTTTLTARIRRGWPHVITMNEWDIYAADGQVLCRMTAGDPMLFAAGRSEKDIEDICQRLGIARSDAI